jgi:hypothetical protein
MAEKATATETREKLVIKVAEHEKFDHIMDSKYLSSNDLCSIISDLFRSVYADYEGCKFIIPQGTNIPTISIFFNHREIKDSTLTYACSKEIADEKTKNPTLRSTRLFQDRLINGDRYYLTEDGQDGLAPFVFENRSFFKGDGSVNWGKLVSEVADPVSYGVPLQFTQVSYLDPVKLLELIYGKTDENGVSWVYGVRVMRSVPTVSMFGQGNVAANMMLAIERVCEPEVEKLAKTLGLSVQSGLNIIR